MPRDLASDPDKTVFDYGAIISPPKDWDRWERLVGDLAAHLVERYGRDEVRTWGFEIWNEANLEVFWSGTRDEYLRLYDVSVRAVKAVDADLPVGGPASAAAAWIDELLAHVDRVVGADRLPVDAHVRQRAARPAPDRRPPRPPRPARCGGPSGAPTPPTSTAPTTRCGARRTSSAGWSARWDGSTPSPTGRSRTTSRSSAGRPSCSTAASACSSVGNLRKPRWWALWMLEQLARATGSTVDVDGDGAGDMVNAVASTRRRRRPWRSSCGTAPSTSPSPVATRASTATSSLTVTDLPAPAYRLRHRRLDEQHSNLNATWARIADGRAWPDDDGMASTARRGSSRRPRAARATSAPDDGTVQLRVRPADARRQPDRAVPGLNGWPAYAVAVQQTSRMPAVFIGHEQPDEHARAEPVHGGVARARRRVAAAHGRSCRVSAHWYIGVQRGDGDGRGRGRSTTSSGSPTSCSPSTTRRRAHRTSPRRLPSSPSRPGSVSTSTAGASTTARGRCSPTCSRRRRARRAAVGQRDEAARVPRRAGRPAGAAARPRRADRRQRQRRPRPPPDRLASAGRGVRLGAALRRVGPPADDDEPCGGRLRCRATPTTATPCRRRPLPPVGSTSPGSPLRTAPAAEVVVDGYTYGSISMTSYVVGAQRHPDAHGAATAAPLPDPDEVAPEDTNA